MGRFAVNDKIEFIKRNEVTRKGIVIEGPYNVDNLDYYHVTWNWVTEEDRKHIPEENVDLICDLDGETYRYELGN